MEEETIRQNVVTAHVLFMDIVGFSTQFHEEQARLKRDLMGCVRATAAFRRAEQSENLLRLDTGDGVALLFLQDPTAPTQCAVEVTVALRERPDLPLRMGIHVGPVMPVEDINGQRNVVGEGVNVAQRVMDCGDAGHILLSERSAQFLESFAEWRERLHRLGEYTVKHGLSLVLYSCHDGAIGNPAPPAPMTAAPSGEKEVVAVVRPAAPSEEARTAGGAVRLGSPLYIARPTDTEFLRAIARQDSIVLVKGARQMGKSSLLARGLQQAREQGARTVWTDFQEFSEESLASANTLLLAMANQLAEAFDLSEPADFWNPARDSNANFRRYLQHQALNTFPEPLVWGLDEVDRLFPYPYANDFFSLIRALYNRRMSHPDEPLSRLTFAIAHSTEPHLFITNQAVSPFNVGVRTALADFTPEETRELNRRYGAPLQTSQEADRLYALLGGHPYLMSRALYEMSEHGLPLDELEAQAEQEGGPFGDHLRRLRSLLAHDPTLTEAMSGVLHSRAELDAPTFYRLRSAGFVAGETEREARPRCRLYANYLQRHLA